ncbi:unnamed protein product [Nezara viridula]|uniref:MICOS complex subunit MIC10 n=1 Tax=Nezara viridula TaxID=85310 RepID=A0A9P0HLW4_NEZVI|nr:unnamed protein product [Nezara viridula]
MSSPPPPEPCKEGIRREDWDKCVRHGTWRVAIGIIVGAIGSAVVVSEMPMVVGTGLGIGWAVRHCKNILRKADPSQAKPVVEDPCACCNSNFEALDKNEFETNIEPTVPPIETPPPPPTEIIEEEKCTCNEIPVNWSPPRPVDDSEHPIGCSCYR